MSFDRSLVGLDSIRKKIAEFVVNRYGVELYNTTTAGMLVDLVAVLITYMQLSRSVFLREANIDTAINPANFFEIASNYGYLLNPCRPLTLSVRYTGAELFYVKRWDVLGSVGEYDVVAKSDGVYKTGDEFEVCIGFFEDSEVVARKDYDTVYVINKGKYLSMDELERFNLSAYPFDLLKDSYMVLRSAGLWRTKLFFGSGVLGGYLSNYPLRYKRLSFNDNVKYVNIEGVKFFYPLSFNRIVGDVTFYPSVEEFRSGVARYSIDKRLVSEQDYELFVKEFFDVKDCKAYNYRAGEIVVRFITLSELVNENIVFEDLDKRKISGASVYVNKEDLNREGQSLVLKVRSGDEGVVDKLKSLLLYKYIEEGVVINEQYINKVLYDAGIVGYVVRVVNPVVIQRVSNVQNFRYGFLKNIDVEVEI